MWFKKFIVRFLYIFVFIFAFFEIGIISPLCIVTTIVFFIIGFIISFLAWLFAGIDIWTMCDKLDLFLETSNNKFVKIILWYIDDWNVIKITFKLLDKLDDYQLLSENDRTKDCKFR